MSKSTPKNARTPPGKQRYIQVAMTPESHRKLVQLAEQIRSSSPILSRVPLYSVIESMVDGSSAEELISEIASACR